MLLIDDSKLWEHAWAYKDHGKSYDAIHQQNLNSCEVFRWVHESFGTNWRMLEAQAAVGRIQLAKLDEWVECRRTNAHILAQRFSSHEALRTPMPGEEYYHSYYKFYTFIQPEYLRKGWSRDKIIQAINSKDVPCFYGSCSEVYREKAFDETELRPEVRLSVAKELGETSLMFPVHPTLSEIDMHRIADAVDKVLSEATI